MQSSTFLNNTDISLVLKSLTKHWLDLFPYSYHSFQELSENKKAHGAAEFPQPSAIKSLFSIAYKK